MNKEFLYCIRCEDVFPVQKTPLGRGHGVIASIMEYPYFDSDFCELTDGVAFCPPPPFDMDEFMASLDLGIQIETLI
jgi:hypothetical protein